MIGRRPFVNVVNGFKESKTMDLMEKYLSRVKANNKRPEKKSYKIYSKILDDYLWLVPTDNEMQELVAEGIKETIYTHEEVSRMIDEGVSKGGLKAIHKVKQAFPLSSVEDVSNEDRN